MRWALSVSVILSVNAQDIKCVWKNGHELWDEREWSAKILKLKLDIKIVWYFERQDASLHQIPNT